MYGKLNFDQTFFNKQINALHCTSNKFETLILDHVHNFTLYFGTALKRLKSLKLAEIKKDTTNLRILTLLNK